MSSSEPQHDMRCCWRCSLLFDAEPVEIGRSEIDPNICIICADDIQRTAPGDTYMDILTTTKTIKVHTLRIDDSEIERYMNDRDAWFDVLSTLLTAKPEPNGHTPPPKKKRAKRAAGDEEKIDCPKCGTPVKPRGLLIHQRGSKCRSRAGISTIQD